MVSTIVDYFNALNNLDRAAYLACFTKNAEVHDPYGARPFLGTAGMQKFMDGFERTWASFIITPGASFEAGDRVAVTWQAVATSHQGKKAEFAGIDVFTLAEDGLISRLEGYWNFKTMAAQIS